MTRIVLAYSGAFEASVAVRWLSERYGAEVVTLTLDLGQGGELETVRDRALAAGAVRAHVLDLREEFASDFILPALKAEALFEDRRPMAAALSHPLIARKLVDIARIEHATGVAHGCGAGSRAGARLESSVHALAPALGVLAPAREWDLRRVDSNLWGRSIEHDGIDRSRQEGAERLFVLTRSPAACPGEPAHVEVVFEGGRPTGINGVAMPLPDLIASLGTIAGANGVGRINRAGEPRAASGLGEVHEAPAAVPLHAAHLALQELVTPHDLAAFARGVGLKYAELVHAGLWFTPLRAALDAFVEHVQQRVTGSVRLELLKGACRIVSRASPFANGEPAADALAATASQLD